MPTREWKIDYEGLNIKFVNHWTLKECREVVFIDGDLVSEADVVYKDVDLRDAVFARHVVEYKKNGCAYTLEIKAGSKWFGLRMGCHIIVDGKLIGGDVRSKLLFAHSRVRGDDEATSDTE